MQNFIKLGSPEQANGVLAFYCPRAVNPICQRPKTPITPDTV